MNELDKPHDDTLVISVLLGNFDIKRVLVDPGSSVNIIYLEMVKEMGLQSQIICIPSVLVFDYEALGTIGEITLITYAMGLNLPFKYPVIDCLSAYNALLRRPWIHKMKDVPSTLHQMIKFQTPWGIRQIKGD
ncbi:hypothetical protein K1719_003679 [Acacia pycnantha]|nr:hypothetical protein K1719_003679 [Acacia pycnantha]